MEFKEGQWIIKKTKDVKQLNLSAKDSFKVDRPLLIKNVKFHSRLQNRIVIETVQGKTFVVFPSTFREATPEEIIEEKFKAIFVPQ